MQRRVGQLAETLSLPAGIVLDMPTAASAVVRSACEASVHQLSILVRLAPGGR